MKKVLTMVALTTALQAHAKIELSIHGGFQGSKSNDKYISVFKPGIGYLFYGQIRYSLYKGLYTGIELRFANTYVISEVNKTDVNAQHLSYDYIRYNFGKPSIDIGPMIGYRFTMGRSVFLLYGSIGYVTNIIDDNVKSQQQNMYFAKSSGLRYGLGFDYSFRVWRKLRIGVGIAPSFYQLHYDSNIGKRELTFSNIGLALGVHYKI